MVHAANNPKDFHLNIHLFSHYLSQKEVTQRWLSLWPTDELTSRENAMNTHKASVSL